MFRLAHPLRDTPIFASCFGRTTSIVVVVVAVGVMNENSDLPEDYVQHASS